ncbi:hypothetical protein [Secundilactobacillus kimchicus]|uniref:hypothetical protein n=1 Tax=Secundilactobacillus kimchicus TaxID=528209 RepID=UPI000AD88834|nr:hypothetical protein [Secundilactobacillus kimchicus]
MAYRTPPFITPFAIVSVALALGATNVVVNTATHSNEGAPKTAVSSSLVESVDSTGLSSKFSKSSDDDSESDSSDSESKKSVLEILWRGNRNE